MAAATLPSAYGKNAWLMATHNAGVRSTTAMPCAAVRLFYAHGVAAHVPFNDNTTLPHIGTTESECLDFKARLNRTDGGRKVDYAELAKDLAAFANAYGGTILVGACERGVGELQQYDALSAEEAEEAGTAYVHAGEALCFPRVPVTLARIACDAGFVLAVNVEPRLDAIVGVRSASNSNAYLFPVRHDDDTKFLNPEQTVLNMLPQVRRTIILLRQIPSNAHVVVDPNETYVLQSQMFPKSQAGSIHSIDVDKNSFQVGSGYFALDRVESVFLKAAQWVVVYRFHGSENRRA